MRIRGLFILLVNFYFLSLCAQTGVEDQAISGNKDYQVVQYNSENGLPQNSVNDLLLDRNHFLWVATQNGLVRFDGQRFLTYNTSNTPVLKSNRFAIISVTARQQVLFKSDFDDSVIYTVTPDYGIEKEPTYTHWRHKLITYHSNGVFDFSKFSGVYKRPTIFCILNEQEAVIRYRHDYYYLNNQTGAIDKMTGKWVPEEDPQYFFMGDLFCVVRNTGEISFFRRGLPVNIPVDPVVSALLKGYRGLNTAQFFIHVKGDEIVLRRSNDFYILRRQGDTLKASLIFRDLSFLEHQPVWAVQYDSIAKRLFLGTQNAGLFVITARPFHTLTFRTPDFNNNIFMAMQFLPGGKILTNSGVLDKTGEGSNRLFPPEEQIDKFCLYASKDSSVWFSRAKRLCQFDPRSFRWRQADTLQLESYITGMVEHAEGVAWISTFTSLLKMEKGKLRYLLYRYPPFIDHTIESIAEVSPGKLWIATRNGLYEYDMGTGAIGTKPLLPDTYVRSIFKAGDGSLWIGTYGTGYFKYWRGSFRRLPLDPDRYLAETHTFLEDRKGFFWISTNHGLFRIRKKDLDSIAAADGGRPFMYYYDKSYGFDTNEFNGGCSPAGLEDEAGHFYLPSMKGVVSFSPDSCRPELPDRPLYVDDFKVDSVNLHDGQGARISPDFNRIQVDISTPFYGSPENLWIEYSLNQNGWHPLGREGKIVIDRLPYGRYTLLIRKSNGWGSEKYSTTRISFEVLPHWYNTGLFKTALFIALLCLIGFLFRARTRILQQQNMRLQAKVDERTFELEKSTIMKEKLVSVIMHDLRSPIYAQTLVIEYLSKYHTLLSADKLEDLFSQLIESGNNIDRFSSDFLAWYESQKEGFTVKKEPLIVLPFMESILRFYQQLSTRKGLALQCAIAPGLTVSTDRHILAIVMRNIVDNAVKNTKSGSIRVLAFEKGGTVEIQVEDTGPGISAGKIRELTDPYEGSLNKQYSFGYWFIREFTGLLGGELSIESNPGKGTTVIVSLNS